MKDLFIAWDASRKGTFTVQAGQFKVPLGRQRLTSSGSQQFVDRSDVVDEFTPGRDIGVQVQGLLASEHVEYRGGVFNGAGENTWSHEGGLQYAGRVMVQPLGRIDYSESDLEFVRRPLLSVAANIETSEGRDDAEGGRQVVLGADVDFRYRGLSLLSEVFFRALRDQADGTGANGLVVQGGYLVVPRVLEIAGRFGTWKPANAEPSKNRSELAFAVGDFVNGHNLKLQTDVRRLVGMTSDEGRRARGPGAVAGRVLTSQLLTGPMRLQRVLTEPLRDAFAVLFFVSVGMLLSPGALFENPALAAGTLGVVMVGKPLAAFLITLLLRYPLATSLSVAVALAQIGEFSFMLSR
jgi:hypothetical protein